MLQSFKNYGIFLVIAVVVATVLLSNKAGVNLRHHHTLPQITQSEKIECSGTFSTTCHIRLSTSITEAENYREVFNVITRAGSGDTIYIHLIGNGGLVSTTTQFYNVIKNSKAKIITVVEGSVYSAHAFITMMGDEIRIGDHVNVLIHTSSAYGKVEAYCKANNIKPDGTHKTDRTQSAYDKCIDFHKKSMTQTEKMIIQLFQKVLTAQELDKVLKGHDIILSGEELKRRMGK